MMAGTIRRWRKRKGRMMNGWGRGVEKKEWERLVGSSATD